MNVCRSNHVAQDFPSALSFCTRQILLDYAQAQFDLSMSLALLERAVGGAI